MSAALSDVWFRDKDALLTIHDARPLLKRVQFVRCTAVHTLVYVITTAALMRS